ncbi:MAG: hypothetical protein U5L45_08835 [Saprospiraceae bacterium]|nr:hypothetical protein [Saprospiraceae bacterium]
MKKLFILALIALACTSVYGQVKDPKDLQSVASALKPDAKKDDVVENKPTFQRFDNLVVPDERYEGVKGSRFFYDEQYHEGSLTMTRKREFGKNMLFRFDQLEGTVQMKSPNGKEILVDQNEILNFNLFVEGKSVAFIRVKTPNDRFSLVQVIYYSPTIKVLRDPRKKLKRVENTGAYSANQIYDTYINDYHYFLQQGEEKIQEVKPTAKSFAKAMPSKAAKVETLFKAAKSKGELSVSKLAEIVKKLDEK